MDGFGVSVHAKNAPAVADHHLSVLIVEDEQPLAKLWASELHHLVEATVAYSLDDARSRLCSRAFDVILLDLHLPDGSGIDLLREVADRGDECAIIILTGNADLNSAIQAIRLGAYDYLVKPCRIAELEQRIERLVQQQRLRDENRVLKQQIVTRQASLSLIGSAAAMATAKDLIARVAPTSASVLICGETGTGKEIAARMIHLQSARRDSAFVPVNCAALPRELAESELFGHRKGAFTGANRDHRGLVLAASRGTLFLDEVGDVPVDIQAKFLRLLENGEARRVGDSEVYRTDVRVIAATNRDLRKDVASGRFRKDLFYRLATFELVLPPLREILEDLPDIANHLLRTIHVPGAQARNFSVAALEQMLRYGWPGNIRELRNVIERAKILCDQVSVQPEHLGLPFAAPTEKKTNLGCVVPSGTIAQVEWLMIQQALRQHDGNKSAAARSLGISLRTLYNRLKTNSPLEQRPSSAPAAQVDSPTD